MNTFCVPILCCLSAATRPTSPEPRPVSSFETPADIAIVKTHAARAEPVAAGVTHGRQALRVEFDPAEWPNAAVRPSKPFDWRGRGRLALDITNPGREPIEFGVRVDDDATADGAKHCRQGGATIEPGASATFALTLDASGDPMRYGMRGLPPTPGIRTLTIHTSVPIDLGHIVAFQIFLHRPPAARILILDNVRLLPAVPAIEGIVDAFGQYTGADWPGKLKDASEFAARRTAEDAELKARPFLPDRDRYGGHARGPKRSATGFFRTEKIDGRWWLITPDGTRFFSLGMDCVSLYGDTFTTGRESMFTWLPGKDDPLARHAGRYGHVHSGPIKEGATFNFLAANLERKFGRDYEKAWFDLALRRLPSWGFNTVANWSDGRLYRNGRVPYVATVTIDGDHPRISSGSDYWGRMHDPFDPRFTENAGKAIRGVAALIQDDPWCVGYFVDNELSWGGWGDDEQRYGLARGALAEGAECRARQAFVARLKAKYRDVAALNRVWGTSFADWDAVRAPHAPHGKSPSMTDALKADMGAFVKDFARQYFRVVRDELRKAAPHHLYLGCRFAWRTPEAVEAAGEICDVVSFNIYKPKVDPNEWTFLNDLNKPCIIGEFHFGSLDRGMFHTGLVAAADQNARAAMYRDYVRSVLDHPALVGCHWFQYVDQPLTGRTYDGENYNIGFVTVTDTPYPEMVAAAREVHREAYTRRPDVPTGQRHPRRRPDTHPG